MLNAKYATVYKRDIALRIGGTTSVRKLRAMRYRSPTRGPVWAELHVDNGAGRFPSVLKVFIQFLKVSNCFFLLFFWTPITATHVAQWTSAHTTLCGICNRQLHDCVWANIKLPTRVAGEASYHTTRSVRGDRSPAEICSAGGTHSPHASITPGLFPCDKKEQKSH